MNDYIDRQTAIAYAISGLIRTLPTSENGEKWIRTVEVRQSLLDVPSTEVEPVKHGRWKGKPIAGYGTVRCSVCGEVYTENNGRWLYCPNCGAKMNWYEKRVKELDYKGCRNCKHQIEPLRGCEWIERGGDGRLHLICPKWEKKKEVAIE